MKFSVLGSGSRGNAVYIESESTGILIDAGFSGKMIENRLHVIDRDLAAIRGICLTHEHNDHIRGAGVLSRRCRIPAYSNVGTFRGGEEKMGKLFKRCEFDTGDEIEIGDLQIRSFRISHDTADPVGYVVSNGRVSLGYLTDTGKVSHLMRARLAPCSGLILEFNHNLEMLKDGPYPLPLQQRVRSSRGHLSNEDGAECLAELMGDHLKTVILAHLSETNNNSELARRAAMQAVDQWGETALHIASQDTPSPLFEL